MAFKKDIFRGAQFVRGYGVQTTDDTLKRDDRFASAVRVGQDDSSNAQTRDGLQDLIDTAVSEFGGEHPDHSGLFLHRVVANHAGGQMAYAYGYYRPVVNQLYQSTPGQLQLPWHRNAANVDLAYPDRPRQRRIPIYTISFRHLYYQDNCPNLQETYHDTINSGSYTLTNYGTFSAKQLLFCPPGVNSWVAGSTTCWEISWKFVYRKDTWIETFYNSAASYIVATRDMYATAAFPSLP